MSRASVAAGADGVMIEVHPQPEQALCDGAQSLTVEKFAALAGDLDRLAVVMGRRLKKQVS